MKGSLAWHILENQGLELSPSKPQRQNAKRRIVTGNRPHLFVTGGTQPHFIKEIEPMRFECDCRHFKDGKVCIHIIAVVRSILPPESLVAPKKIFTPAQLARNAKKRAYFKKHKFRRARQNATAMAA